MHALRTVKRSFSRPGLLVGGLILMAFAVIAMGAPLIAPPQNESPYQLPRDGFSRLPQPPSPKHPLGTLAGQYDVFYGLVWGTRAAFRIGLAVALGRAVIGLPLGLFAGYYGQLVDAAIMRLTDAFMALPIMAAAMVMLTLFGNIGSGLLPGGQAAASSRIGSLVTLTLILFGWMQYARLMRGNVLAERNKEYIQGAVAVGVPGRRILFRHLLPNVTQGVLVLIASDIGAAVVLVAAFNFLGFLDAPGREPSADWGQMLTLSRDWIIGTPATTSDYWHTYLLPSMAILFFSVGWNLVGDGLRDIVDPRL